MNRVCVVSKKTLEQLEFDKLIKLVQVNCKGQGGVDELTQREFCTNVDQLQHDLWIVQDYCQLIADQKAPTFNEYGNIEEELYFLEKEGYVLELESIIKILFVLLNYDEFYNNFDKDKIKEFPHIYHAGIVPDYVRQPIVAIKRVFDEEGNVRPDASPELAKVYKRMVSVAKQLDVEFNKILSSYKDQNILADNAESWRNGRRVLVIPVENKRKISGVIHDQSASGKTIFMEPEGVMRINNELFSLENEKRAEIYKILRELSAELRMYRSLIGEIFRKIGQLDSIRARAIFSLSIGGIMPKLNAQAGLKMFTVKHPLLLLHFKNKGGAAIPFDLDMKGDNRLLLISGPNAGGKSVTLKAVGLTHLMTYFGLLVPVASDTEISMFRSIHTDIGDQQSIDEGLSTYSSHLTNLNQIVQEAGKQSLILLDEIGSGTDPKLGGAIAEGILKALMSKKVYGIVTTHYSSLKVFAFRNPGIVNGAMLFDKENLQPVYKLKVGKPGSSYAFEVAKKIGLDDRIIGYARKKVGKKENEIEDLLIDLQEGKAILDEQLDYVANEKSKLERLIKTYDQLNEEFQLKRKKLQIQAKEVKYQKSNEESIELQNLISKLEKEKNLEKARQLKVEATQKRQLESDQIIELKRDVSEVRSQDVKIEVGASVRMLDSEMTGEVLSINGDKAEVLFGLMRMWIRVIDLVPTREPLQIRRKGINIKGVAFENNFSPKLDIRGYKLKDAEESLDEFIDKAILANVRTLEIVHGKGSGALRKLVISKVKEYRDLESYWHPSDEMGGDGITMIKM